MNATFVLSDPVQNIVLLFGRALLSAIYIVGGYKKLVAPQATQSYFTNSGVPLPKLAWIVAVIVELLGGLALLLGIQTRPVAALLALWSIATAVAAHSNFADHEMRIHFMKNLAMAGGYIVVAVLGAGVYALG